MNLDEQRRAEQALAAMAERIAADEERPLPPRPLDVREARRRLGAKWGR